MTIEEQFAVVKEQATREGVITILDPEQGWGYVAPATTLHVNPKAERFFPASEVVGDINDLYPGARVKYIIVEGSEATEVAAIEKL